MCTSIGHPFAVARYPQLTENKSRRSKSNFLFHNPN